MLAPETAAAVPLWNARKVLQWEQVKDAIPGLQLVQSGPMQSTFMLVHSTDDNYEGIVFGQLPQPQTEVTQVRPTVVVRDVPDRKKHIDRRSIDLSDDQIDQVIDAWRHGESAATLPFVLAIWGTDGKPTLTKADV